MELLQTFSKLALLLSVPLQRILVDHNLPAGAAGIRTISCCACKLIVKMWFQISHVFLLSFFIFLYDPRTGLTNRHTAFFSNKCGTLVLRVNFFYLPMTADLDSGIPVFGRDVANSRFITVRSIWQRRIPIVVVSVKIILSSVSRFSSSQITSS